MILGTHRKNYFNALYYGVRIAKGYNRWEHEDNITAKQCYLNKEAPTKNDLWQAYYTNAKLDAGYYLITPQMVFDAVSNQTELDVTRVYIRKATDKHCTIEIVCRPVVGWGTFFGFDYIDAVKGIKFCGLKKRKTYFKVEYDGTYMGSQFMSVSFYQWYDPPYKFEKGWTNG